VKIKEWRADKRAFVWGGSIHNKSLIKRPDKMLVLFTLSLNLLHLELQSR
jgi:hypothetical protein